jgi:hypothetical protein
MRSSIQIENIEARRLRQGIDDVELREEILGLRVGDSVRVTLLTDPAGLTGETLPVRITRIRGATFRGKLTVKPASSALAGLRVGTPVAFTADHIHSLPKQ